jgi:hypothetical protein
MHTKIILGWIVTDLLSKVYGNTKLLLDYGGNFVLPFSTLDDILELQYIHYI